MALNVAVILAAGVGSRSGFQRPKQLTKLAGKPLISHTIERFQQHPEINEIAVVSNSACIPEVEDIVRRDGFSKVSRILNGGKERYESSLSAIRAFHDLSLSQDVRLIFHDAVRPLVSQRIISDVCRALDHFGAVDVAIDAVDTVIDVDPTTDTIVTIPERSRLRLGQTPQAFRYEVIRTAYERALVDVNFQTTDDCGVVLRYAPEHSVYVVPGEVANLKLTYAEDLLILDKLMQAGGGRRLERDVEPLLMARLKNQNIVIIGGTSGIGASMAEVATAHGAKVTVAGRSTGFEIASPECSQKLFKQVQSDHGPIAAIVNSAAILNRKPLAAMTAAEVKETVSTNIEGCFNVALAAYPYLRGHNGHLMFFASSSYTYGRAFYSTYSASKAAVVNLTQALAEEWRDDRINVNCVNPERARTPMRIRAFGAEDPQTLLEPTTVARKALGVLVSDFTGYIVDISKALA